MTKFSILKRIFRIGAAVFVAYAALNVGRVVGTNAYFTATAKTDGVLVSAGWWVKPAIKFDAPKGGETWQVGSTQNLKWKVQPSDPDATIKDLKLEYSCDNKDSKTIEEYSDGNAPDHYAWTVPNDYISDHCKIKITATDSHDLTASAESDKFSISWMVALNEIMPKPAIGSEWVEFYNLGGQEVDMRDWKISELSSSGNENKYKISSLDVYAGPSDYKIQPGDFLAVKFSGSKLNDSGDTVTLYDPDGNMIDSHKYSASDVRQGKSIARVPDGTGDWIDPIPTPGAKNTKKNSDRFMRHYYRDACFDKKGDPQCAEDFLKNLGLWIDKMPDKTDDASNNTSDHSDANTPPEAPENGGISQDNPPAGDGAPDGYHRGQWKADGNGANQSENGWQSRQRTGTQTGSHAWTAGQHFQRTFDSASAGN